MKLLKKLLSHLNLTVVRRFPFIVRMNRKLPYEPSQAPSQYLDPRFFNETTLRVMDDDMSSHSGELYEIWHNIEKGRQWHHYFETYEAVISKYGKRAIRMLEIGVFKGGSAEMWQQYLHPDSIYVGIDINPECKNFEDPDKNIFIRIGDQSDPEFLGKIIDEFGPFDFILDDGSHVCSHMISSFNHLFLDGLTNPGIYLVEDTHANYWPSHRDQKYSFVDLAKDMVDLMNYYYIENVGEGYFQKGHPHRLQSISVPRIAAEIEEIQFKDSLVLIHKKTKSSPPFTS